VPRRNGTDVPVGWNVENTGFPVNTGAKKLVAAKNGEEGANITEQGKKKLFVFAKNDFSNW
jgi:hypothetical protein